MSGQLVQKALDIIGSYDIRLTVRQIYYRLVAAGQIKNTRSSYNVLDKVLTNARMHGAIPFEAFEDRSRKFLSGDLNDMKSPEDFFEDALYGLKHLEEDYEIPLWLGQPKYVEVWIEKDALASLFLQICDKYNVRLFPSRGYPSVTLLYEAARHLRTITRPITILYFGDFDMRGVDIERYLTDRLQQFGVATNVKRLALTRQQVEEHRLPPQPAKKKDTMARPWIEKQGDVAWELDALDPNALLTLVKDAILEYLDENLLQSRNQLLAHHRRRIRELVRNLVTRLE